MASENTRDHGMHDNRALFIAILDNMPEGIIAMMDVKSSRSFNYVSQPSACRPEASA